MRKTGFGLTVFGAVFGILLFFVRRSDWYLPIAASNLSETAEFIESSFWACIILFAVGVLLLLLSLRKPAEEQYAEEEPYDEPAYDAPAYDGTADETYPAQATTAAAYSETQPHHFEDPWRPDPDAVWQRPSAMRDETVRVPELKAKKESWVCDICGCENPQFSGICAVCGSARGSKL